MRIIAIKRLKTFWEKGNTDSEQPLKVWYQLFRQNNFSNTNEIKRLFPSCSFVGENRVVFNISGNKYRLVVYLMRWPNLSRLKIRNYEIQFAA